MILASWICIFCYNEQGLQDALQKIDYSKACDFSIERYTHYDNYERWDDYEIIYWVEDGIGDRNADPREIKRRGSLRERD